MQKIITAFLLTVISFSGFCNDNPYQQHIQAAISSAAGTPWSAKRHVDLITKINEIYWTQVLLTHPISEENLEAFYGCRETIPFFAYSSLIDKDSSAAKAISVEGLKTSEPAVAFGIQRVFNREMTTQVAENFGPLRRENDVAILNVFEKKDAACNGVLLHLTPSDLLILAKREVGYDLIPVPVVLWSEALENTEPTIILAYTFCAPDYIGEGTRYTNDAINPIPGYVTYLQKGLKSIGQDFEAMWWATTYLADKKTSVSEMSYHEIDCAH